MENSLPQTKAEVQVKRLQQTNENLHDALKWLVDEVEDSGWSRKRLSAALDVAKAILGK